ncbi:response regulator [Elusimicrobiota bacterium]
MDILIVDDEPHLAEMLKCNLELETSGIKIESFVPSDSRVLPDMLRKEKPKLVVLDVMMPGSDGITLCGEIKKDPLLKDIKIVIWTAKPFEQDRLKALSAGADDFLSKIDPIESICKKIASFMSGAVELRFWGVRGSFPTPGPSTVKYGGNTSCVEVRMLDKVFIFDGGTGIRELGKTLLQNAHNPDLNLFISHFHWDHIQGLPFFLPNCKAGDQINLYGCEESDIKLDKIVAGQMESVYFPIRLRHLPVTIQYNPIQESTYKIEGVTVKTLYLFHPGNTVGYRLEVEGKSIVYMPDNEIIAAPDKKMIEFSANADILIHDGQYTEEEYPKRKGWGHSPYTKTLELAALAKVKSCYVFHHDPDRSDAQLEELEKHSQFLVKEKGYGFECKMASEGTSIKL